MERLRMLAATLWAGSLWGGALVAWRFFATLDRATAGAAVTSLFATQAWIAAGCAIALLLARPDAALRRLVLAMLACALTIRFGLQPVMEALKAQVGAGGVDASLRTQFGLLHGAAGLFYLLESVLAAMLAVRTRR